jgi:KDO2-lipid IV(A) lauroyltransferase
MAKPRNHLSDFALYLALRLVSMFMHCWPVWMNYRVAKLIGDGVYFLDRRHRERAEGNLRRSMPELPDPVRRSLARQSMRQMIELFVEVLFTTRLVRVDTFARHFQLGDFAPGLRLLIKRKGGLIMLTGHYGNWEVLGYALATLGFPTTSIARPLDNPYINNWLLGVRERRGQRIIAKTGATDDVTKELERGGVVGFIADQNAGPKGIFVDFFGRKASAYKSIGLLAMQYEVPVVIGYARRQGPFQFSIGVQDVISPADWEKEQDPLRYVTQRYTKAIEDFVRADPAQYLWVHRRWKTRPKGEAPEQFD